MKRNKNRLFNLDFIRVFGLLFIVFNHALNTVWDATDFLYWDRVDILEKNLILISYSLCRLGVPLFLMISGALILNKKFDTNADIIKFYKNNLFKLIFVVIIWNTLYYFFNIFYYNSSFSLKDLVYIILFMKNSPMPHMWYMPMIIGMYVALPYLSVVVKKFSFKELIYPICLIFLFYFLIPNFKTFLILIGFKGTNIRTIIDSSFLGGTYGIYIIMGYYIYNHKILEKIKSYNLLIIFSISIIISCLFQMFSYINDSSYIIYYNFIGILVSGIFLFEFLRRSQSFSSNFLNILIEKVSKYSLGIYFVHRPILFLFKKYSILSINSFISIIIYYIASLIISYVIVNILKRVNFFKKYLFLIKD